MIGYAIVHARVSLGAINTARIAIAALVDIDIVTIGSIKDEFCSRHVV
jgi:hypothetical protein